MFVLETVKEERLTMPGAATVQGKDLKKEPCRRWFTCRSSMALTVRRPYGCLAVLRSDG